MNILSDEILKALKTLEQINQFLMGMMMMLMIISFCLNSNNNLLGSFALNALGILLGCQGAAGVAPKKAAIAIYKRKIVWK